MDGLTFTQGISTRQQDATQTSIGWLGEEEEQISTLQAHPQSIDEARF